MRVEILKAAWNWWTAIKGEEGDFIWIYRWLSSKNHQQLLLPQSKAEETKYQEGKMVEWGHFALDFQRQINEAWLFKVEAHTWCLMMWTNKLLSTLNYHSNADEHQSTSWPLFMSPPSFDRFEYKATYSHYVINTTLPFFLARTWYFFPNA